jgi:hypothetical protein
VVGAGSRRQQARRNPANQQTPQLIEIIARAAAKAQQR